MILLNAWSRPLISGKQNPKNYPWWPQVLAEITVPVVQVAVRGEQSLVPDTRWDLNLTELAHLVDECDTWLAVDSFFQHFCWDLNKQGIVVWGPSNPHIFGHEQNINLTLGTQAWRANQFLTWEQDPWDAQKHVPPKQVLTALCKLLPGSTST
jgi:hypothetical protein